MRQNYTRRKKFKRKICSPFAYSRKVDKISCYDNDSLMKLKTLWNNFYPLNKINETSPRRIWSQLQSKMTDVCFSEDCWLKQPFAKNIDKNVKDNFAPDHPKSWNKNPVEWLSNYDILDVMKQYEKLYKCFKFIGPTPIDFDLKKNNSCITEELCKFDLNSYINKKKTKIGIVFNTDAHDKGGEHWISLFINIKKGDIFFFDSAGDKILPEIKKLVDRVICQGKNLNPPIHFTFDENGGFRHQKTTTECGMYSLFFIINMLTDKKDKKQFKTTRIPDEEMISYRKTYFNDPE